MTRALVPGERTVQATDGAAAAAAPALWRSISALRGLAMCLVVANHAIQASSALFVAGGQPTITPAAAPWTFAIVFVIRALTPVCLVAFFFASGFMAFRFLTEPRSSRAAASQLARKYLLWSVAMLAFRALTRRGLTWREAGTALVLGTAQEAYWFLEVLLAILLGTPLWNRIARMRARWSLLACAAIQVAASAFFYLSLERGGGPSTLEILVVRPLLFLPAFIAGMWVSRNASWVSQLLLGRRGLMAAFAAVAAAASLAESWLLGRMAVHGTEPIKGVFATERVTLIAFALAAIAALIGTEIRNQRLAGWLRSVGTSSLGIMLLMDACMKLVVAAVWHLPPLVSHAAALARAEQRLPLAIAENAVWLTPVLFAAGLWGPLRIMERMRRFLGSRVRYLW